MSDEEKSRTVVTHHGKCDLCGTRNVLVTHVGYDSQREKRGDFRLCEGCLDVAAYSMLNPLKTVRVSEDTEEFEESFAELNWMGVYNIPWFEIFVEAVRRRPGAFGLGTDATDADIHERLGSLFEEVGNAMSEISGAFGHYLEWKGYIDPPEYRTRVEDWRLDGA